MSAAREPILEPVAIAELKPTQMTVGMREVRLKRKSWEARSSKKDRKFLGRHMLPAVLGPGKRHHIIDNHHLAFALFEEGVKDVLVRTVADLSRLEIDAFWVTMDNMGWLHPFDQKGRRRGYDRMPDAISGLEDDPFRSLAGELRRVGGFAKNTAPFSEFLWADFLRRRMKRSLVEKEFSRALELALEFAKSIDADYLPGWCGAAPDA